MNQSIRKKFGERIRELRKAKGFTQEAFADRCGYARTYLSRIETGGANVSLDAIEVLATALGVAPSELLASTTERSAVLARERVEIRELDSDALRHRSLKGSRQGALGRVLHEIEDVGPTDPELDPGAK